MRILVTGGAGFIGSAFCRHLIHATGHHVINVDKLTYAASPDALRSIEDSPRYRFHRLDILDGAGLGAAMRAEAVEAVVHLAAESHADRSIERPRAFVETNILGTYSLLEAARSYWSHLPVRQRERFRLHHVSTDEVYGSLPLEGGVFAEDAPYRPSSPYSASKAASDHLVTAWHRTYGLPVVLSNASNNYGPWQFPEKLIPLTILNALEERPLPVYGTGRNVRDWLFVEDHAGALEAILTKGRIGERYNVGGGNERANIDVVRTICRHLDRLRPRSSGAPHEELIAFVADRPGHDLRYAVDNAKLRDEIGWSASQDFETGLLKTIEWYLAGGHRWNGPRREKRGDPGNASAMP